MDNEYSSNNYGSARMGDPLRIVIVISDLGRGGAERQVIEIANGLNKRGCEVHVVSLSNHNPLARELCNRATYFHVVEKKWRGDISVVFRLAKTLRALRPKIVHAFLFDAEIVCRLSSVFCQNFVLVGSERNADYRQKWYQFFLRRLTNGLMDYCIANSEYGAEFNRKLYSAPKEKYRVVHNGVNTGHYRPGPNQNIRRSLDIAAGDICVGMFASFKRQKNHAALIRAIGVVGQTVPNVKLLLVGGVLHQGYGGSESYHDYVAREVAEAGIVDKTIFLGPQDELERLYRACDVVVLPSLHEGFPNVVLEAQACGVPCIVSDVSDNRSLVVHERTGLIYPVEEIDQLVEYLHYLIGERDVRMQMGEAARAHMLKMFSLQAMLERIENTYREMDYPSKAAARP